MTQPDIKALENAREFLERYRPKEPNQFAPVSMCWYQAEELLRLVNFHLQSLKAGNDVIKQDIPAGDYICDLHVIETGGEKQWFLDSIRTGES